jgi:sugar lactone lactonase YvrE
VGSTAAAHADAASVSYGKFALAAPDGRTALVADDSRICIVRRVQTHMPVWRDITTDQLSVDKAAWSQDSNVLAIYDAGQAKVFLWKNVQTEADAAGSFDMSQFPDAPLTLAVDAEARYIFATFRETEGASLVVMPIGGAAQTLLSLSRPGPLLPQNGTLYVADRGRAEVYAVSDWTTGLTVRTVVAAGNGITDPAGIALSRDGKQIYVADAGSRQVLAFELGSSTQKAAVQLDFPPTRLDPIEAGSLFLLDKGSPGEAPAQLLQAPGMQVFDVALGQVPGGAPSDH